MNQTLHQPYTPDFCRLYKNAPYTPDFSGVLAPDFCSLRKNPECRCFSRATSVFSVTISSLNKKSIKKNKRTKSA